MAIFSIMERWLIMAKVNHTFIYSMFYNWSYSDLSKYELNTNSRDHVLSQLLWINEQTGI